MNKNINYLNESFKILFKTMKEYRANVYSAVITLIFYLIVEVGFFFILYANFGDVIGWSLEDFIIFNLLLNFCNYFVGIFIWTRPLSLEILDGKLNQFLIRPMGVFFQEYTYRLQSNAFLGSIFYFLGLVITFTYFNISVNFFLLISLILIVGIYFAYWIFTESFALLKDKLDLAIQQNLFSFQNLLEDFPAQFWQGFKFKYILGFMPAFWTALILIPIVQGKTFLDIWFVYTIAIAFLLGMSLVIWFNWHYGLKRYEAFN